MRLKSFILNYYEIRKKGEKQVGKNAKIIPKSHIPEDEIEALAKCFLPDILEFFESEEGRKEFEQWKREQAENIS